MFDLVDSPPHDAGGLSNVAPIIGDLLHKEHLSHGDGERNQRRHVIINTEIEHDL